MLQALPLDDAELAFAPAWLSPAQALVLFEALQAAIAWDVHRIRLFGRELDSPRLSCWIGDPGASYVYSGARFEPQPWPAALAPIRARLRKEVGIDFNSVLANLYRDGRDHMGWHSDDEPELGARPVVASVSLGATRRFAFKRKTGPGSPADAAGSRRVLALPSGSLLLMQGDTQRHYKHALPRTARQVGARINLTFRRVFAR